ncbi:MAG: cytochrome c5 family protein [Gammaproteobacteria bacterium]|nr:cytochrome c5 family protein [Gammaproteobacteria bacterium]
MLIRSRAVLAFNASMLIVLSSLAPAHASQSYQVPDDQQLVQGRELWLENCETCHGCGIADAPIPMQPGEWRFRLAKGKTVLYRHAIEGFIGPDYSMMPARGGNDALTDEQVKLAVDYIVLTGPNKLDSNEEVNNDSTTN